MKINEELLAAGASEGGGFSRQQLAQLGVEWPLSRGWKRSIIGRTISDDNAQEFLRLASRQVACKTDDDVRPVNWCGSPDPVDIYLYVLALADGCYYVGLTYDVAKRVAQHKAGEGAEWTKLHAPVRLLHNIATGTQDGRAAEQMEDEVTVTLMLLYGIDNVRGGHFSFPDQALVEANLRGKGYWERIKHAELEHRPFDTEASWAEALDSFIEVAIAYYDAGAPPDQHDAVFAACYKLTRYRYWHEDFVPGLGWHFWNRKGILPVLLSFKLGRPVGSRQASVYEVFMTALQRGKHGRHPLRRLFLLAWQTYTPPTTGNQATAISRLLTSLDYKMDADYQYDAFVSVLLPETRYLLRQR